MADIDYDDNAGSLTISEDLNLTLDTNGYTFSRYRTYSSTYTPYEKVPVNPVIRDESLKPTYFSYGIQTF